MFLWKSLSIIQNQKLGSLLPFFTTSLCLYWFQVLFSHSIRRTKSKPPFSQAYWMYMFLSSVVSYSFLKIWLFFSSLVNCSTSDFFSSLFISACGITLSFSSKFSAFSFSVSTLERFFVGVFTHSTLNPITVRLGFLYYLLYFQAVCA